MFENMIARIKADLEYFGTRVAHIARREFDASLLRVIRYQGRIEQLVEEGKSPQEAIASVEKDVLEGKTGTWPMDQAKPKIAHGGKKRK